jgi:hypothetical protein
MPTVHIARALARGKARRMGAGGSDCGGYYKRHRAASKSSPWRETPPSLLSLRVTVSILRVNVPSILCQLKYAPLDRSQLPFQVG